MALEVESLGVIEGQLSLCGKSCKKTRAKREKEDETSRTPGSSSHVITPLERSGMQEGANEHKACALNLRMVFSVYTSQTALRPSSKPDKEACKEGSHMGWRSKGLKNCECPRIIMHRLSVDKKDPQEGFGGCDVVRTKPAPLEALILAR